MEEKRLNLDFLLTCACEELHTPVELLQKAEGCGGESLRWDTCSNVRRGAQQEGMKEKKKTKGGWREGRCITEGEIKYILQYNRNGLPEELVLMCLSMRVCVNRQQKFTLCHTSWTSRTTLTRLFDFLLELPPCLDLRREVVFNETPVMCRVRVWEVEDFSMEMF